MNPGRGLTVVTFAPRPKGPRDDPDEHAVRILRREGDAEAAIAFAQARIDSHQDASASKGHWVSVIQVLRRMQGGGRAGDHRPQPRARTGLPLRDSRPAWPCAGQDSDFIHAFLMQARPGGHIAIRRMRDGRISYVVCEITAVNRGLGRITVGARAFQIRSGHPVDLIQGCDERLVTVTRAVRAFSADYPGGREARLLRNTGSPI